MVFRSTKKLKTKIKLFLIISMFFLSFSYGLVVGTYKIPPFKIFSSTKNFFKFNSPLNKGLEKFNECKLPVTQYINQNTHIFIGHAYGSPLNSSLKSFISPNLEHFLNQKNLRAKSFIFTGDVFSIPSITKWARLRYIIGNEVDIFIAPGNHDVLRPDSRDSFNNSEFGKTKYPFFTLIDSTPLVLDDSVKYGWEISKTTLDLITKIESKTIIIARHNPPINELKSLINSYSGLENNLDSVEDLIKKLKKNTTYYWIIGDGGAFERLPRISCLSYKNHFFLINGLGNLKNDTIILYSNNEFKKFILN